MGENIRQKISLFFGSFLLLFVADADALVPFDSVTCRRKFVFRTLWHRKGHYTLLFCDFLSIQISKPRLISTYIIILSVANRYTAPFMYVICRFKFPRIVLRRNNLCLCSWNYSKSHIRKIRLNKNSDWIHLRSFTLLHSYKMNSKKEHMVDK